MKQNMMLMLLVAFFVGYFFTQITSTVCGVRLVEGQIDYVNDDSGVPNTYTSGDYDTVNNNTPLVPYDTPVDPGEAPAPAVIYMEQEAAPAPEIDPNFGQVYNYNAAGTAATMITPETVTISAPGQNSSDVSVNKSKLRKNR